MPKASEVAIALRALADSIDRAGENEIDQPTVYFSSWDHKQNFLNLAQVFPRPFTKDYEGNAETGDLYLRHRTDDINLCARISRNKVCEIIEPAKPAVYRCEPILSDDEDAGIDEGTVEA